MMLLRMAWRNLWRSPRRTAVVLSAITVGIAGSLLTMALNYGMVAGMVDTAIRSGLGHIQVHAAGWDENPELKVRLLDGGARVTGALDRIEAVRHWAPRLLGQGLVASPRASVGVAIAGVDPVREPAVSVGPSKIVEGEWLGAPRKVVLGHKLAGRLEAGVGSKVVLSVQSLDSELTGQAYRVAGIIKAGSRDLDDGLAFLGLVDAQDLFEVGDAISEVVVVTHDRSGVQAIQSQLESALGAGPEVRSWSQLEPLLVYMVDSFESMAWVIYIAVFIAMAFGIANVLLMAVYERTREIGMMRAMGMNRARVVGLVVIESSLVTVLGLVLGVVVAVLGVWALGDGIDISRWADRLDAYGIETVIRPVMRGRDLRDPMLIGAVAALLSSFWPAVRAARARPADALRKL